MKLNFYSATQMCISRICYGNVAGSWLAGWLAVCKYAGIVSIPLNLS